MGLRRAGNLVATVIAAVALMSATAHLAMADNELREFWDFMRSGRAPEALDIAERRLFAAPVPAANESRSGPPFADIGMLGEIARTGQAEPLVERFRSEIRRRPDDLRLRGQLAALLYADWRPAEADIELARLFARPQADTARWHQFAAGILRKWNRPHERIRHLRRATELPVTAGDLAASLTACAMGPSQSRVLITRRRLCALAEVLMADGEWAQARDCWDTALAACPTSAENIVQQQRKSRAAIKEAESRIAKLDKLIDPRRGDLQATMEKAELLLRVGRVQDASEAYQLSVRTLPASPRMHAGLAEAYARLGRTEEAIAEYLRALELMPVMDPRPWLHIGPDSFSRWLCRLEELCQAADLPKTMIEAYARERHRLENETAAARPALVRARVKRNLWLTTTFMLKNKRATEVVDLWAQWREEFPDDAAQAVAGLMASGVEPDAALRPFSPRRPDGEWPVGARIVTAAGLHAAGRTAEARAALVELSQTLPANDLRRLIVASMLDCQSDAPNALKTLQPALGDTECDRGSRAAALRIAIRLHLACGESAAAVRDSEELLRLYPDDMNARRQWAAALAADGRPLEWWGIAQEEVTRLAAGAERKATAGDRQGAFAIYRRLLDEARPSDGHLALRAAELCRAEGDAPGEIAWLQRAHAIEQSEFGAAGWPLSNRLAELYRARNDIRGLAALERDGRKWGDVAFVLARNGRLREALDLLEEVTTDAPDGYSAYLNRQALAKLYLDADRADEARILCNSLFEYLMAKQKLDNSHGLFLANALRRLGEYGRAAAILEHTERHRERRYSKWIRQAEKRLAAQKKLAWP